MGYFQDDNGNKSMMRLLAFMGFFLGAIVIGFGFGFNIPSAIIAGCTLAGSGEALKSLQKKFERK